jgi:probable phosphoglycerate mutase
MPHKSSKWIFLRHGESVANYEGWLSGFVDVPLTAKGVEQAASVAEILKDVEITRIYSSDLVRAKETARVVAEAKGLDVVSDFALRERSLGDWAHRQYAEIQASGEGGKLISWRDAPPNGESLSALAARVMPFLGSLDVSSGTTLVVAHGGVIRVICGLLDGVDKDTIGKNKIPNATPIVRVVPDGAFETLAREVAGSEGELL